MAFRYVFFSGGLSDNEIPKNPKRNPTKLKNFLDHKRFYATLDERVPLMMLCPNLGGEWTSDIDIKAPIAQHAVPPRICSPIKPETSTEHWCNCESKNSTNTNLPHLTKNSPEFLEKLDNKRTYDNFDFNKNLVCASEFADLGSSPRAFRAYRKKNAKNKLSTQIFHPRIKTKKLMNYLDHKRFYDIRDLTVPRTILTHTLQWRDQYVASFKETNSENSASPCEVDLLSTLNKPIRLIDYINHRRFYDTLDNRVPAIIQSWKFAGSSTIPDTTSLKEKEKPKTKFEVLTTCIHLPRKYLFRRSMGSDSILEPTHSGPSYIYKTIYRRLLQKELSDSQGISEADIAKKKLRVKETARKIEDLALEAIFLINTELGKTAMVALYNAIEEVLDLTLVMVLLPNENEDADFWLSQQSDVSDDPTKSSNLYKSILTMLTNISRKKKQTDKPQENLNSIYASNLAADIQQRIGIIRKMRWGSNMPEFLLVFVDQCNYDEVDVSRAAGVLEQSSIDTIVVNMLKRREIKRRSRNSLNSESEERYKHSRVIKPAPWKIFHDLKANLKPHEVKSKNLHDIFADLSVRND